MIYLDNAATSFFKPKGVADALNYDLTHSANSGRSGHKYALDAAMKIEDCRNFLLSALGAPQNDYLAVFTKNCTEALNLGIFGFLRTGMRVVTTAYDHNSVLRPLFELEKRGKIELMVIEPDENGVISSRTKTKLLEILGFGGWEQSRDADEAHIAKAERENFELATRDVTPDVVDDHALHIAEHTRLCVSAPCEKDEAFHERVSAHINKHKELAALSGGVSELEKRLGGEQDEI